MLIKAQLDGNFMNLAGQITDNYFKKLDFKDLDEKKIKNVSTMHWRGTWTDMPHISNPSNTGQDTLVKTTSTNLMVTLEVIVMHCLVTVASESKFVLIFQVDDEWCEVETENINTFRMNLPGNTNN